MKTASQYKIDIKSLMDKVAAIDAKAAAENRDLTDSEIAIKNEMMDTVEELNTTAKTLERQDRVREMLDKPGETSTVARNGDKKTPVISAKDRFGSFGEQLVAVIHAATQRGSIDPRLYNAAATGANETVPSEGGLR